MASFDELLENIEQAEGELPEKDKLNMWRGFASASEGGQTG